MTHTTIEEAAREHGPGPWWLAHDHPERPPDRFTVWDWACRPCYLHLMAAANVEPPAILRSTRTDRSGETQWDLTLVEVAAQCTEWRQERGL